MKVGLLTEEQKELLVGQLYMVDTYFNPTLDGNDNWFISTIEMEYSDLQWVKELPLIDYVEPTTPPENE